MKKPLNTLIMNEPSESTVRPDSSEKVVQFQFAQSANWFYGSTDTGHVRTNNEDSFLCDVERGLFIVADGMGGHAAGEEASRIVIEVLSQTLTSEALSSPNILKTLIAALRSANAEVMRQSQNNYEWQGMGSTAVVAVIQENTLYLANVGDSRAYVVRGDKVLQASRDHSLASVMAEQKYIKREEIRTHPMRNRLTMCLGLAPDIAPDTKTIPLKVEDVVLLCSDGLWDMLPDSEIGRLLEMYPTPQDVVTALVQAANEAGGKDNITVIALRPRQEGDSSNHEPSEDTVVVSD